MKTFVEYLQEKEIFEGAISPQKIVSLQKLVQAYGRSGRDLTVGDVRDMMKTGSYGFEDFIDYTKDIPPNALVKDIIRNYIPPMAQTQGYKPMTPEEMQQAKANLNKLNIR